MHVYKKYICLNTFAPVYSLHKMMYTLCVCMIASSRRELFFRALLNQATNNHK